MMSATRTATRARADLLPSWLRAQDLAAVPSRAGKVRRAVEIGRVLVDEALGVLKVTLNPKP